MKVFIQLFSKPTILWIQTHGLIIAMVAFLILQHFVSIKVRQILARKYKYTGFEDQGDESYILYYKKLQHFELIRFIILSFVILFTLAVYQSGIFSVLAVAV